MSTHEDARIRDGALLFLVAMETMRMCEKVKDAVSDNMLRAMSHPDTVAADVAADVAAECLRKAVSMMGFKAPVSMLYRDLLSIGMDVCRIVDDLDYVSFVMES